MKLALCDSCKRALEQIYSQCKKVTGKATILFHGRYMHGTHCNDHKCLVEFIETLAEEEDDSIAQADQKKNSAQ